MGDKERERILEIAYCGGTVKGLQNLITTIGNAQDVLISVINTGNNRHNSEICQELCEIYNGLLDYQIKAEGIIGKMEKSSPLAEIRKAQKEERDEAKLHN